MRIPENNIWTQFNNGDLLGVLNETENISLDGHGKITLSRRSFAIRSSADDADFEQPLALVYFSNEYFILTRDNGFRLNNNAGTIGFTEVALTADVAENSDALPCFGRLYISTNDNLDYLATNWSLTAGNKVLTASVPHPLCLFDSQPTYKLAIGNANTVLLVDSSHNTGATLTLPVEYRVACLTYRNGYLYIGTKHLNGGEAKVFVWDGATGAADFEVPTGASEVYSLIPYKTAVVFVTNKGQLMIVSGNQAVQLGAFPVYYAQDAVWDDVTDTSYLGKVLPRGMAVVGDDIYIVVDGTVDSGNLTSMKHGLWVYDGQKQSLYHRSYPNADRYVSETPSNLSSNTLTLSTHKLKEGDLLVFVDTDTLTGVDTDVKYYVSVESAATVKLALSHKSLKAGNYVTIGGSIGSATVAYIPNTHYAAWGDTFSGPIMPIVPEEQLYKGWSTPVLWATRLKDTSGSAYYALHGFADGWNIGRFIIQKVRTKDITEVWKRVFQFFTGVHLDNEKIIVKAKASNVLGYPTEVFQGTWASTTTISSVSATQDEDQWTDLEVGDELTIVDGVGRGYTTHITAIDASGAPTYTITVDEAIGDGSSTVYFYADKFKKIQEITNARAQNDFSKVELDVLNSPEIMLKCELRGFAIEVHPMELVSSPSQRVYAKRSH